MSTLTFLPVSGRRALLCFGGLATFLTATVWSSPTRQVLGHPGADAYNHLWGYVHISKSLSRGRSPIPVQDLGWPDGGDLWFIDSFGALLSVPFQWMVGPALAFNLVLWAQLVFAGMAAWVLARRVTGSSFAAGVAGVGFATCPYLLSQLHNGITETVAVGWLPLCGWLALRFGAFPSRARGMALGASLAAASLTSWYLGGFSLLLVLGMGGLHGARARPERLRALCGALPRPALLFAAIVGPVAWWFARSLQSGSALVRRDSEQVAATLVGHDMVDVLSLFIPGVGPDRGALFDEALKVEMYVGLVLLVLAWAGALTARAARPWMAGALMSAVLSLGAWLYMGGVFIERPGGGGVPLPFLLLSQLPGLSTVSHAYRFAVLTQLCLCVSAAFGALWVGSRWGGHWTAMLTVAVALDLLVAGPFPVPTAPVGTPDAYARIQDEGAVLDLPVGLHVLGRGRYAMYQLGHGRPIPYALDDPTPSWLYGNGLTRMVMDLERTSVDTVAPDLPALDLALGRRQLQREGLAAVVVHSDLYPKEMLPRVLDFLEISLGPGVRVGDQVVFGL